MVKSLSVILFQHYVIGETLVAFYKALQMKADCLTSEQPKADYRRLFLFM